MITNEEIKFFNYLDFAVEYQKGLHEVIKKTGLPFDVSKIIAGVDQFDIDNLHTTKDCIVKIIAYKTLKNSLIRRNFKVMIREGLNDVDFSLFANNIRYQAFKKKIFNNDTDLMSIDDESFLRQVANAIAHGNYVDLFNIDEMEQKWKLEQEDKPIDELKESDTQFQFANLFGGNPNEVESAYQEILRNINRKARLMKVSPLRWYMNMLSTGGYSNSERVKLRYVSQYVIDENGNRVRRATPKNIDLELNSQDIDEILLYLFANIKNRAYLALNPKIVTNKPVAGFDTPKEDAEYMLNNNDVCKLSSDGSFDVVQLDDKQKQYFVSEYINSREMFSQEYYQNKYNNPMLADFFSTNATSQLLFLSEMLTNNKLNKLSYPHLLVSSDYQSYFSYIDNVFRPREPYDLMNFVDSETKKSYAFRQVYFTYAESLITEVLLMLKLIEDRNLNFVNSNNINLTNMVSNINVCLNSEGKAQQNEQSFIRHLRNSLTHLAYLINSNNEIFIYDQVSNRNKDREYKFTITISDLEALKDELLTFFRQNCMQSTTSELNNQ
jgi:hypothetical protein